MRSFPRAAVLLPLLLLAAGALGGTACGDGGSGGGAEAEGGGSEGGGVAVGGGGAAGVNLETMAYQEVMLDYDVHFISELGFTSDGAAWLAMTLSQEMVPRDLVVVRRGSDGQWVEVLRAQGINEPSLATHGDEVLVAVSSFTNSESIIIHRYDGTAWLPPVTPPLLDRMEDLAVGWSPGGTSVVAYGETITHDTGPDDDERFYTVRTTDAGGQTTTTTLPAPAACDSGIGVDVAAVDDRGVAYLSFECFLSGRYLFAVEDGVATDISPPDLDYPARMLVDPDGERVHFVTWSAWLVLRDGEVEQETALAESFASLTCALGGASSLPCSFRTTDPVELTDAVRLTMLQPDGGLAFTPRDLGLCSNQRVMAVDPALGAPLIACAHRLEDGTTKPKIFEPIAPN